MKIPKNVKTGDLLELTKKDIVFLEANFEQAQVAESCAMRMMTKAKTLSDEAWKVVRIKWPELDGFELKISYVHNCFVVQRGRR